MSEQGADDGSIIELPNNPVVKSYNSNKGGVDLIDQHHGYYMSRRKSGMVELSPVVSPGQSIVNAHILKKLLRSYRNRTQLAFHLALVSNLISNFSATKLSTSSVERRVLA